MTNTKIQIDPLTDEQILPAAEILTQAFLDDPLAIYTFPDREQRSQAFAHFMLASLREGVFLKGVYSTIGQATGAAIWYAPDAHDLTPEQAEQVGWSQVEAQFGSEAYKRFTDFYQYVSQVHKRIMAEPHWYLNLLGVSPHHQRQGIGSALIAPVLQQADRDNIPCYLETYKEQNVAFYQRHGFHLIESALEPQSQVAFWSMRREPQATR
jgi:GNAT superfamily N-acetyltransferase